VLVLGLLYERICSHSAQRATSTARQHSHACSHGQDLTSACHYHSWH
jgi:hypothetical protein